MTMYDVDATELIEQVAKELRTGVQKERPPAREDWWYVRAASILRKVRLKGPIGVSKLRTLYGGKQSRGYTTERYKRGAGNLIRKILQQLEKAELIKQDKKGVHKGRVITPKGIKLIDTTAKNLVKKPVEQKEAVKEEKKEVKVPKTIENPESKNG